MAENFRFVWTKNAVRRYLRSATFDPRHTVSNVEADLGSPWIAADFGKRASGSLWILVDENGHIAAGSEHYRTKAWS